MSIDTRDLTGARASSAVRCVAKAEHEALGSPRDEDAQAWLQGHFRRGVNVGRAWAAGERERLLDDMDYFADPKGRDCVVLEANVPWGLGWVGHVDLLDYHAKRVTEAYHAAGGAFREEKALQAAFYADSLGPEYSAELAVIDTTDVSDEEGFAVQPYEINVDGLRQRVRDIKHRVITAVEAGVVNMDDRVGDSPFHQECRSCPFKSQCWADWRPPTPDEVPGLDAEFEALRITESDLHFAAAKVEEIKARRDSLRDAIRPYTQVGVPVVSGGTLIRRSEVAGRVTFKLGDATKAGHTLPEPLAAFITEGKPSERWKVEAAQ